MYAITKLTLGSPGIIEISKEQYDGIKSAREALFEVLHLEEVYDIVIENYLEYETELVSSSARWMLFRDQSYSWFQKERSLVSRHIANLLSACRQYLDQCVHNINNIYGKDSAISIDLKKFKSTQYDAVLGYRAMEAIRNYSQHRGFPIHDATYNSTVVERYPNRKILFTLTPYIDLEILEKDGDFKRAVLDELIKRGKKVDVKPLIREYIEAIGTIHAYIREVMSKDIDKWDREIENVIESYKGTFPDTPLAGLAIIEGTDDDHIKESLYMFYEFMEHRKALVNKNRLTKGLASRFVTSEVIESKSNA